MDERTYAKFYDYGAAGFANEPEEFHHNRFQNFQNFLDENSHMNVVPLSNGGYGLHCQKHILIGGQWRCQIQGRECPQIGETKLWDHSHAMRLKGISKSIFVATHPYWKSQDYLSHESLEGLSGKLLQGLTANIYHESKSWYYPEVTSLILIGRPDILDLLSTECLGEPVRTVNGSYEGLNL